MIDAEIIELLNHVGYYYRRLNDGSWKRIGGGWNKKIAGSSIRYTTKQLFDMIKKQNKPVQETVNNELPIHFEFNQWEQCFAKIRELWLGFVDVDLIVSCHPYSSGYWIELAGGKLSESDIRYGGYNDIVSYEGRIRCEIKDAENKNKSARFTL